MVFATNNRLRRSILFRLADAYVRLFHRYDAAPVLFVNTDGLNFVDNPGPSGLARPANRPDAWWPGIFQRRHHRVTQHQTSGRRLRFNFPVGARSLIGEHWLTSRIVSPERQHLCAAVALGLTTFAPSVCAFR